MSDEFCTRPVLCVCRHELRPSHLHAPFLRPNSNTPADAPLSAVALSATGEKVRPRGAPFVCREPPWSPAFAQAAASVATQRFKPTFAPTRYGGQAAPH